MDQSYGRWGYAGGIMTLVAVMGDHWHAVERDLLDMGYRADDIGTERLTLWELISIVVAAPPNTAVHYKTGQWDKQSEMLANMSEQSAGLLNLRGRYMRPGVDGGQQVTRQVGEKPWNGIAFTPMGKDDFLEKRAKWLERQQNAARKAGKPV